MIDRELINEIVEKNIAGSDIFIVDIAVKPDNIISVIIDSDSALNIDRCADVNRYICDSLETAGEDDFELSVYSAGLSEPLKLKRQYLKHLNSEVEILRKSGDKQKGILLAIEDDTLVIEYEAKEKDAATKKTKKIRRQETIALDSIKTTKLVIRV